MHRNLRSFLDTLRRENELIEITAEVDPYLEIAEIHRRVLDEQGKALFFTNVKGSQFPVVTNLFGSNRRIELAFGSRPLDFVKRAVDAVEHLIPPTPKKLWQYRDLAFAARKIGTRRVRNAPVLESRQTSVDLEAIPFLQLWPEDGGHFNTLGLVYTESPIDKKHNLGIYRMQRYDKATTGMHWQIGKGGGFHYFEAESQNRLRERAASSLTSDSLPVTVYMGGPPALILSAVAPLPEGVGELMLASLLAGEKLATVPNPIAGYDRLLAEAEFGFVGHVPPHERKREGPFGDHFGYYSLTHDFPVFHADAVFHRKDAIYPATVVGKPRQEDFFIGDYLQELLSPLFPVVMPAVRDLWSYGETGFHSLAAAVVNERYAREALSAGFRILGEGQLTLTKFLLLTDTPQNLRDFKSLFEHVLARVDWQRDFFIFGQTAFDTLDYASGKFNQGSKAILMGLGDAKRELPREFSGELPAGVKHAKPFCAGCLVLETSTYIDAPDLVERLVESGTFDEWQMVVLHDDISYADSPERFLWATWTRFDPARDTHANGSVENNHIGYESPIFIDARMKPWYPKEVEADPETVALVDRRWSEYFPK